MKIIKASAVSLGLLLATTVSATAADMFVPAAPVFDWSGFYIGAVAGGGVGEINVIDDYEEISYGAKNFSEWGGSIGGTIGFNMQSGSFVYGLESDISWSGFSHSHLDVGFDETQWNTDITMIGTVRVRGGLAVDNTLIYATGGLAFANLDVKGDYEPTNSCGDFKNGDEYGFCYDDISLGWTVGAGVEHAFSDSMTVKIEGLYMKFATEYVDDVRGGYDDNYAINADVVMGRIGVNWKF